MKKWNCKQHKYEKYSVPNNWHIALWADDLNIVINCANCGKEVQFGDTYTSKLIHNDFGLGFCVCEECYNKEMKEYLKEKRLKGEI